MAVARFLVSGKVQGVFFRVSTRERALDLGLSGRATNLPDGSVEVVVEGKMESIAALESWLQQGPAAARVDVVARTAWNGAVSEGFVTG